MSSRSPLAALVRKHVERDPAAVARDLETMEEADAVAVLKTLPPTSAAHVIQHIQSSYAAALISSASPELLDAIVHRLRPEQAVSILKTLAEEPRRQLLERLSPELRPKLQELLTYPEDSAGRIMTTDFLAFRADVKVKDAIGRIRSLAGRNPPTYAYVVDGEQRLLGVLNMRDLLVAPSDATVDSIMQRDVFAVDGFLARSELAYELSRRHFFAAPVLDAERRLLGVVRSDQLLRDAQHEATEDLQKMVGLGGDERPFSPVGFSVRARLPWLQINLATAFLAASVVGLFEDLIAQITVLAVFLPVVAGQGGNAGAQSLAVAIRGLVMREITPQNAKRLVLKEAWLGALNGVITGLVTAAVAWIWKGNAYLGLVIGLAMVVNLVAAGACGAAIPIVMKAVGRDPARSSNIILTTVTDCVGFFAFLGFALIFRQYLL